MRKRDKISILKKMLVDIQQPTIFKGMCLSFCRVTNRVGCEERLFELGLKKPKKPYSRMWWYEESELSPRIRAINRAIKKLQS